MRVTNRGLFTTKGGLRRLSDRKDISESARPKQRASTTGTTWRSASNRPLDGHASGIIRVVATCLGSVALASVTLVGASLLIGTPQAGAQTVTATLDVGSDPEGVAITPNSEYAYVTNEGSNYVNVINTTENTAATVDVGSDPEGVAITPNGADAYVVNNGSNTVSVIDTATNSVTATVNVGSYPVGVAITPNGEFAYVTNFYSASGEDTVSVIDTATNTVTATVNVGSGPENVAITPTESLPT
jgi:YVTN family beta-propeller protein